MARRLHKLPSEILNEDSVWIGRLAELEYHLGKQDVNIG